MSLDLLPMNLYQGCMNGFRSLFTLFLFSLLASGVAQEGDKSDKAEKLNERKAKREQLQKDMGPFLEKYFPGRAAELKAIQEDGGKKALKKAQREDRQVYQGFKERTKENGLEHAEGLMHLLNVAREMQAPLAAYKEAQGNVKKQAELRKELEPLFAKQHGLLAEVMGREIKILEAEVRELPKDDPMTKLLFLKTEELTKKIQETYIYKENGKKAFDAYLEKEKAKEAR